MVTERIERKKGEGKSYTASKEMKISTWQWSCQKPQNKLEDIVQEGIVYYTDVWEDCL